MTDFEQTLNDVLVDTFNGILRYEELCLKNMYAVPVTVSEAHMIDAIGKAGNPTVSEIAGLVDIAMPTATVAVKRLESKGFVTKTQSADDGRKAHVQLTGAGDRIRRAHNLFHQKMVCNISDQFNESEKEILLTAIQKISLFFGELTKQNKYGQAVMQ